MSEEWTTTDTFYERICPPEGVTVPWNHISFAQEPSENYLYAPCAGTVFREFRDWLRSDDFLCWWTRESAEIFDILYEEACGNECPQPHRFLKNFFASKIKDGFTHRGNLYSLARERGLTLFLPEHCSLNDVKVLRQLMLCLGNPEALLSKSSQLSKETQTGLPFWFDTKMKVIHMDKKCAKVWGCSFQGFKTVAKCCSEGYKPCPQCCGGSWEKIIYAFNCENVKRTKCGYFYFPDSNFFHRGTCKEILFAVRSYSAVGQYKTCINKGYRPCKLCNPEPGLVPDDAKNNTDGPPSFYKKRSLNKTEQKAMNRFMEAKTERASVDESPLSDLQKRDARTLSSPEYVFWAAKGYANFHLRQCKKLAKLSNLRGFRTYEQAVHAGYQPCRECRPSSKENLKISVSSFTKEKKETEEDILALCNRLKLSYEYTAPVLSIRTEKAKWKLNTDERPVVIQHKPMGAYEYHTQHRMFLSVTDAVQYIYKHDDAAKDVQNS